MCGLLNTVKGQALFSLFHDISHYSEKRLLNKFRYINTLNDKKIHMIIVYIFIYQKEY